MPQLHKPVAYLAHHDVDQTRWDEAIDRACNGMVYGQSFYLNSLCPGWSAIVGKHYEWIMPVTDNRKFGIRYLFQPFFTQQLGVFYLPGVVVPYREILQFLQHEFRFCDIAVNHANKALPATLLSANNFILDLSQGYETIQSHYHSDLNKNLKKSGKYHFTISDADNYQEAIDCFAKTYGMRIPHVSKVHYGRFSSMCRAAAERNMLIVRKITGVDGSLMAIALMLHDGKRLYNLMNTTSATGKAASANHFLLDGIIREFAGQALLFDFEGSDIEGIRDFYVNFGAVNEPYYRLRYNHLPPLIKWFRQ